MGFYQAMYVVMQAKGITAAELSRKTGLRKSYFTELKNGRVKSPTWQNALAIMAALGMTPDEFAALEDELECM